VSLRHFYPEAWNGEGGDFSIQALSDRRTRGVAWGDKLALQSPRHADYVLVTLGLILS
jgi:hypothetical protein